MFRIACIVIIIHHVTAFIPSQLHTDSNQGLPKERYIDEIMDRIKQLEISSIKDREIIEDLKASSVEYRARINVLETATTTNRNTIFTLEAALADERKHLKKLQTQFDSCILKPNGELIEGISTNGILTTKTSTKVFLITIGFFRL